MPIKSISHIDNHLWKLIYRRITSVFCFRIWLLLFWKFVHQIHQLDLPNQVGEFDERILIRKCREQGMSTNIEYLKVQIYNIKKISLFFSFFFFFFWFGITCVRYEQMAQVYCFSTAICGCWFDLQRWRLQYTLLMRPNKVEIAVQCSRISCVGVHRIFWSK